MCHVLLLLPVLALPLFWVMPLPLAGAAYGIVLLFSVWLYRTTVRSMKRPVETGVERIQREVGEIVEVKGRKATVRLQNELWHCEGSDLKPGDLVKVTGVDGLNLRVEKSESETLLSLGKS